MCEFMNEEGYICPEPPQWDNPCCSGYHGRLRAKWRELAANPIDWALLFSASNTGKINELAIRRHTVPEFEYYHNQFRTMF